MVYGPYKRTMATDCRIYSEAQGTARKVRAATTGLPRSAQWHSLDITNRSTLGRPSRMVSPEKHLPSAVLGMDRIRCLCQDSDGVSSRPQRAWRHRPERRLYRRDLCSGKKRGDGVGKTKKGKGTKIMGLTDAFGLPIAIDATSAQPHKIKLLDQTLDACFLEHVPEKVIGDKAYDSDKLDQKLADERGVDLIAPHKGNRKKTATQDLAAFSETMEGGATVCLAPKLPPSGCSL